MSTQVSSNVLAGMNAVKLFHMHMNIDYVQSMPFESNEQMKDIGERLVEMSQSLEVSGLIKSDDKRFLRGHLMIEELGETLIAMAMGDEVKALDGLADLLYVVFGTALTFRLPLHDAFAEVHDSNMTKTPRTDDNDQGPRLRPKGVLFKAPDIAGILSRYKANFQR